MQIGLGFSRFLSRRLIRRLGVAGSVLGGLASVFTFVTIDLARKDAHFSPTPIFLNADRVEDLEKIAFLEVELRNLSEVTMRNLTIQFTFYDHSGEPIISDDTEFTEEGIPYD